jgi:hypothetical protein
MQDEFSISTGPTSDDMETYELFHPIDLILLDQISSSEEIPAKRILPPESIEAVRKRRSAMNSSGLLLSFARDLFSGKIPRESVGMLPGLGGDFDLSSNTLVTLCCPLNSEPVALGHPINGSECSCSPILPTPTANLFPCKDVEKLLDRREREVAKGRNGNGFGLTLAQWVAIHENQWSRPIGPVDPRWIEWLMGFPSNWTEPECSEMPLCPPLPSGSAKG